MLELWGWCSMNTKIVVRLLGLGNKLLGWAECVGHARGDGKIWIDDPTTVMIEEAGETRFLSVHWCDVNVEVRNPVEVQKVTPGMFITLPGNWPAITCGPAAGGLPPVTVRSPIKVGVPVGAIGGRGN